jgi:hypothetical protein
MAQTPSPTPSPAPNEPFSIGGYEITSSIELGVRGLDVKGSDNKFRSDFNYKPGFRVFDSSFLVEDKTKGVKLFDSLLVTSSGFGADPTGFFRLNMEKVGVYRLDSNVRSVKYFNNLNNHALGEHGADTKHKFGDIDLTIFPQSEDLRFRLGYSFNQTGGTGGFTTRAYSDEFPITSFVNSRSYDFRAGVDVKLFGFNLALSEGYRNFTDKTSYTLIAPSPGNNPANTARLATFQRNYPIEGNSYYTLFSAHRTFAKRIDFTGRFIYSSTDTKFNVFESITGRDNSNNIVDLDRFEISGDSKRPQGRGDVGLTFLVTKNFRISETFTFDQFNISGGNRFLEQLIRRNNAGNPLATTLTNTVAHRVTSFRRVMNTIEADYQFSNQFAFNVGYRYTDRRVVLEGFDRNLTSANPTLIAEEFNNRTNTLIAGLMAKPFKNLVIYADVEHGQADNVFTRLANYNFTNFRVRSRLSFNQVSLNFSIISKDNNNPSRSVEFPTRAFSADTKNRTLSGALDWTPNQEFSVSGGYTYQDLTSKTDIIVPVGGVLTPGVSQFFMRDNYFFLDVFAKPIKRVSLYASYRISKDFGQGDRVSLVPQNILTSYPFQLQSPEIRLALRLTKNIDWSIGYQYYDYREKFGINQNYSAHMPYTSLRIYFGGGDR